MGLWLLICIPGQCQGGLISEILFELEIEGGAGGERGAKEPWPRSWSPVLELLSFSFFYFSLLEEEKANSFLFLNQYSSQFYI